MNEDAAASQVNLEAEMEKNRILQAALATKDSVTRKYMRRSRELSRLQASIDDTTKQLKTLMTELGGTRTSSTGSVSRAASSLSVQTSAANEH